MIIVNTYSVLAGLSLRGGGLGSPLATMNVVPSYFHTKIAEK